jgi:hypothetical protein
MADSFFTTSNPTPRLPPATNTGDLPRYLDAIMVMAARLLPTLYDRNEPISAAKTTAAI